MSDDYKDLYSFLSTLVDDPKYADLKNKWRDFICACASLMIECDRFQQTNDGEEDPMFDPKKMHLMVNILLDPKSKTFIDNPKTVLFIDPVKELIIYTDKHGNLVKKSKPKGKFNITC